MLIPVCCFSCGACIGHLWETYQEYVKSYQKQISTGGIKNVKPLANNDEVNKRITCDYLPEPSAEELALISLRISRMCCRRMFLTQTDTYHLMNLIK